MPTFPRYGRRSTAEVLKTREQVTQFMTRDQADRLLNFLPIQVGSPREPIERGTPVETFLPGVQDIPDKRERALELVATPPVP